MFPTAHTLKHHAEKNVDVSLLQSRTPPQEMKKKYAGTRAQRKHAEKEDACKKKEKQSTFLLEGFALSGGAGLDLNWDIE